MSDVNVKSPSTIDPRTAERDLHQEIAQTIGGWVSWQYKDWFTDGAILARTPFSIELSHRMVLDCGCRIEERTREHYLDAARSCVYISNYSNDTYADTYIEHIIESGLAKDGEEVTFPPDLAHEMIGECPVPLVVSKFPDGRWLAVQFRHLDTVSMHTYPDRWEMRTLVRKDSQAVSPVVIGLRRGEIVSMIPTVPLPGSVYSPEAHAEVLMKTDKLLHEGHGCALDINAMHGTGNSVMDGIRSAIASAIEALDKIDTSSNTPKSEDLSDPNRETALDDLTNMLRSFVRDGTSDSESLE